MRNVELRTGVCRGYAVVVLCGELDTRDAGGTAAAVAALAAGGQQLIIDLETLDFIDCHAAGALLGGAGDGPAGGRRCAAGRSARAGAAAADRAGRIRCPCQRGRRRGQRRQARCPAACGQHRTTREGGAVRHPVLDDGVASGRPGGTCRKPVLVAAVTARTAGCGDDRSGPACGAVGPGRRARRGGPARIGRRRVRGRRRARAVERGVGDRVGWPAAGFRDVRDGPGRAASMSSGG